MVNDDEVRRAETALRIAQLKLKQALKKDERLAPAIPLESSAQFCVALDSVLQQNTPGNIQTCKDWIVKQIAPSKARIAVLGEYLVAVARSIIVDYKSPSAKSARNRLDILLVVSDVLHFEKFHRQSEATQRVVATELIPYIGDLVELAAQSAVGKGAACESKLKAVINFWAANECINAEEFKAIRERAADGTVVAQGGTPVRKRTYTLPDWHGDRNVPWHGLPASYMLEPMIKYPDRPINTSTINVKRLNQRQPSERIRNLLEDYFENIDLKYVPSGDNPTGETKKFKLWLDPMGQLVKQNKESGETKTVCNGYGWSMKFCQDMQENGIPAGIIEARETLKRVQNMENRRREAEAEARSSPRRHGSRSPSPRRRQYSSSSASQTRSPSSSRESYGGDQDKYAGRRRLSSRDDGRNSNEQGSRSDEPSQARGRPPPHEYSRDTVQHKPSRWNQNQGNYPQPERTAYNASGNNFNPPLAQGFPQISHPQNNNAGFVPPPPPPLPAPGQFAGYTMQQFPPPPPYQGAGGQIPPPPPPNFNGNFPGAAPDMSVYPNNPYNFGNNNPAYGHAGGHAGQPQQAYRGGFRGGYQGRGGYRGGYQGNQQGQGGRRWN